MKTEQTKRAPITGSATQILQVRRERVTTPRDADFRDITFIDVQKLMKAAAIPSARRYE